MMTLNENDAGKTVEIQVGDELDIILEGNPTTGYVWEVMSINSTVLKLSSSSFVANDNTLGANGMETIKFQALTEGQTELNLHFHRPFESNKLPLKTFTFTVIIK